MDRSNLKYNEITKNVFSVGAEDWDRQIFDELVPLPDGTSYNAYLIRGSQKTALIDSVDPAKSDVLMSNLEELGIKHILIIKLFQKLITL